jgi:hypothetical protein
MVTTTAGPYGGEEVVVIEVLRGFPGDVAFVCHV